MPGPATVAGMEYAPLPESAYRAVCREACAACRERLAGYDPCVFTLADFQRALHLELGGDPAAAPAPGPEGCRRRLRSLRFVEDRGNDWYAYRPRRRGC